MLNTRYDAVIRNMGEPDSREVVGAEGRERYMLHYDGISFQISSISRENEYGELVNNGRVARIYITGEQFRLGGRQRIGVGSTRRQVEREISRRSNANTFTADCSCSRFRSGFFDGAVFMEIYNQTARLYFDENNRVTRITLYNI